MPAIAGALVDNGSTSGGGGGQIPFTNHNQLWVGTGSGTGIVIGTVAYVNSYGADPSGGAASDTAFAEALASLPTITHAAQSEPCGALMLGPTTGSGYVTDSPVAIGPSVWIIGPGSGICTWSPALTGGKAAISTVGWASGAGFEYNQGFHGFTLDGTLCTGGGNTGILRHGTNIGCSWEDFVVQSFADGALGTFTSQGVQIDAAAGTSGNEKNFGRIISRNNDLGIYLSGANSKEYTDLRIILAMMLGQSGFQMQGNFLSHSRIFIVGNCSQGAQGGAYIARFGPAGGSSAQIHGLELSICMEANAGTGGVTPTPVIVDANTAVWGRQMIDLTPPGGTPWVAATIGAGSSWQMPGPAYGGFGGDILGGDPAALIPMWSENAPIDFAGNVVSTGTSPNFTLTIDPSSGTFFTLSGASGGTSTVAFSQNPVQTQQVLHFYVLASTGNYSLVFPSNFIQGGTGVSPPPTYTIATGNPVSFTAKRSGANKWVLTLDGGIAVLPSNTALLARVEYDGQVASGYTTTSTTLTAIDTMNMTISFTASSSAVLVRLEATCLVSATTPQYWALFTHGGSPAQEGYTVVVTESQTEQRAPATFLVTGLTSGNSYQFDWYWAVGSGTGTLYAHGAQGIAGANRGGAIMEVWAA